MTAELTEDQAPESAPATEELPELPPDRFLDRELSWLAFNDRVLQLAEDGRSPCWNGRSSAPSSRATSTNSSWSEWPDSSAGSPRESPSEPPVV
ncbi:MAG: hypothetical protein V9E98_01770 [Candidatus Nanopelagicales bacterium]